MHKILIDAACKKKKKRIKDKGSQMEIVKGYKVHREAASWF